VVVCDLVFADDGLHTVSYGSVYRTLPTIPPQFSGNAISEEVEKARKTRDEQFGLSPVERSLMSNPDWLIGEEEDDAAPSRVTRAFGGEVELSPDRIRFFERKWDSEIFYFSASGVDLTQYFENIRAYFRGTDVFDERDYQGWGLHSTLVPPSHLIRCLQATSWYDPSDPAFTAMGQDPQYIRRFIAQLQSKDVWGSEQVLSAIRRLPKTFVEGVRARLTEELAKERKANKRGAWVVVGFTLATAFVTLTTEFEGFASLGTVVLGGFAALFLAGLVWNVRKTSRYARFLAG
jgi:hypothetical protein